MNSDTVVIERSLSLKDPSPFIVVLDSFAQSSQYLINEIIHRNSSTSSTTTKVFLSFETVAKPNYINAQSDLFIDCMDLYDEQHGVDKIVAMIKAHLTAKNIDLASTPAPTVASNGNSSNSNKVVIIVDSLNYVESSQLSTFAAKLMIHPNVTVISTYHLSVLESESKTPYVNYPSKLNLLTYIATTIFEVSYHHQSASKAALNSASLAAAAAASAVAAGQADEYDEEFLHNQYFNNFFIPLHLNNKVFKVNLTKFKKSGKKLEYKFKLDYNTHEFSTKNIDDDDDNANGFEDGNEAGNGVDNDDDLFKDLSTFNLSTSSRQKQAKSQVELPFLDAQRFESGGAIVYQFEKDDDYDEEDPYEDPF